MFYGFHYFDIGLFIFVVPAMLFALGVQIYLKSVYRKQARVKNTAGLTGAQAAYRVLQYYGITDVHIEQVAGNLTDHYDPRTNIIRLSSDVYNGASIAAVGIACHEAGHAAQHAQGYLPIRIRNAILPVCNIGSQLGLPLAILGFILSFDVLVTIGLMLYALIVVFQFATLPVEFNASSRAIGVIDEVDLLSADEARGAKKVLGAAAMTYVASLVVALANLLRFVLRFSSRQQRR